MAIKQDLKPPEPLKATVNAIPETIARPLDFKEAWGVIRWVLVAWSLGVWLLLVMMPGLDKIINASTAILHLPNMFIGLGLIGAIFAAYSMRSDKHLLWFLGVLLLLAGWM